jgi:hypothetical protein
MAMPIRDVFVIMPFNQTPTRRKEELDSFYECNLKKAIEECTEFKYQYRVSRSDDSFDINSQIIRSVYTAEIVLCDLSGEHGNPNVMFELGIRLSTTSRPVIMFREQYPGNKRIFDVSTFYTMQYSPLIYPELEAYIIKQIKDYESGIKVFRSPVLTVLEKAPSVVAEQELRRAILQFKALRQAMLQLLRGTGGAVYLFIRDHDPNLAIPTGNALELLSFLEEHRQQLSSLDWTSLMFQPNVPPSLQSYLTSFPLEGLVEQGVQALWNSVLSEFFGKYFGTNTYWRFLDFDSIQNLVGDATVLLDALTCFIGYLEISNDDADIRKELLASTIKNLRRNPLWDESEFSALGLES